MILSCNITTLSIRALTVTDGPFWTAVVVVAVDIDMSVRVVVVVVKLVKLVTAWVVGKPSQAK